MELLERAGRELQMDVQVRQTDDDKRGTLRCHEQPVCAWLDEAQVKAHYEASPAATMLT